MNIASWTAAQKKLKAEQDIVQKVISASFITKKKHHQKNQITQTTQNWKTTPQKTTTPPNKKTKQNTQF